MDTTHLLTHKDTNKSVRSTHIFIIINIVVMIVFLGGTIGWLLYAHSHNKWPYDPYVRQSGPPGTQSMRDYIQKHQAPGSAAGQSGGQSLSTPSLEDPVVSSGSSGSSGY